MSSTRSKLIKATPIAVVAIAVYAFFKKVVDLKKLAADANIFFPVEFENAVPKMIKRAFLKAAKEVED